jgi:hypothetical protein
MADSLDSARTAMACVNDAVSRTIPKAGDVLVSTPTATIEYYVSVVADPTEITCLNHDAAVAKALELARDRLVDAWLTEDHTHFLRIASYRTHDRRSAT